MMRFSRAQASASTLNWRFHGLSSCYVGSDCGVARKLVKSPVLYWGRPLRACLLLRAGQAVGSRPRISVFSVSQERVDWNTRAASRQRATKLINPRRMQRGVRIEPARRQLSSASCKARRGRTVPCSSTPPVRNEGESRCSPGAGELQERMEPGTRAQKGGRFRCSAARTLTGRRTARRSRAHLDANEGTR